MPVPLLVLIGWGLTALTAYEIGSTGYELWMESDEFKKGLREAEKKADQIIESLKKEIDGKIGEREQVAALVGMAKLDGAMQGHNTKNAMERGKTARPVANPVIATAIKQNIPFRVAIGLACKAADSMPVFSLRKKPGMTVKDVVSAKKTLLKELAGLSVEQLTDMSLDDFYVVTLKQLALSLLIEYMDSALDWQAPLKAEVNFGPGPKYDDHGIEGTSKLIRKGKLSPFWPAYHRKKGSIHADIMIPERRKQRPDKSNIFAIVEIKFPNDRIEQKQFDDYNRLLKRAAEVKTDRTRITLEGKAVNKGGDLALFRYPEDQAVSPGSSGNNAGSSSRSASKTTRGKEK